jgi:hypothetical protein
MAKQKYPVTGTTTEGSAKKKSDHRNRKSGKLAAKRERKRDEADERMFEHNSMTLEEKIAKAKSRRGESKRELARLNKQLAERPPELAPVKTVKKKTYSKPSKS